MVFLRLHGAHEFAGFGVGAMSSFQVNETELRVTFVPDVMPKTPTQEFARNSSCCPKVGELLLISQ